MSLHEQNTGLNDLNRQLLVEEIVVYFITHNKKLSALDCDKLSDQIVIFFPGELKVNIIINLHMLNHFKLSPVKHVFQIYTYVFRRTYISFV